MIQRTQKAILDRQRVKLLHRHVVAVERKTTAARIACRAAGLAVAAHSLSASICSIKCHLSRTRNRKIKDVTAAAKKKPSQHPDCSDNGRLLIHA